MPRLAAFFAFLCFALPAPALADLAADRAACFDSASLEEVVEGCARLLTHEELSDEERVDAHFERAEALYDLDRSGEALADYDAAIAIDPTQARLYGRRAAAKVPLKDFAGALADIEQAIALEPDNPWFHYVRGFVLERQDRLEEALGAYQDALDVYPGYRLALESRGRLYLRVDRYAEAIADFDAYLEERPYASQIYAWRALAYENLGDIGSALRDNRTAQLIDPNTRGAAAAIAELLPEGLPGPEAVAPIYRAPDEALAISYLRVWTLPLPELDEMEEAIGGLVGWFAGPKELPVPSAVTFIDYEVVPSDEQVAEVHRWLPYPHFDEKDMGWTEKEFPQFFAVWPEEIGGNPNAPLAAAYDRAALARVWELEAGQQLAGRAKVQLVCPAPELETDPVAVALGCSEGVRRVPIGSLTWNATFEGWETVLVPAGIFSTARLSATLDSVIHVAGGTIERRLSFIWWYAPEVRWWVRRVQTTLDEERHEIMEAVSIAPL